MTSGCGLHDLASAWAPALPTAMDGEDDLVFARGGVGAVPNSLDTGALVIKRSHHIYGGYFRADALTIFATKQTFREWGLLLVAHLLADAPTRTEVRLTHPDSDIKLLRVEPAGWSDGVLAMEPTTLTYWPSALRRFPWPRVSDVDAPEFFLSTEDELGGVTDEEWAARDTVVGHGQGPAVAWLAALLLDLGNPEAGGDEFRLEAPGIGNGGTAPGSAEVTFWLPGSIGWVDFGLEALDRDGGLR
jgi:hypothetical protein